MKKLISSVLFFLLAAGGHNVMAGVLFNASGSNVTTYINKPVAVNVSALNGGSSQVYVTAVQLTATSTAVPGSSRLPMAFSVFNPFNTSITIGAGPNVSSTRNVGTAIFFSPSTGITNSGTGTYSIGGSISLSDGTVNSISQAAVITVQPVPLPAYERQ